MTWPSLISLSSPLAISPCSPEAQTLLNCFQTLSIVYCLWTSSMLLHWPEMPWHLPCLSNQLKVILQMSPREVFWAPSSLMPHLYPYHTTMSSLRVRTILYSYLYFQNLAQDWCVLSNCLVREWLSVSVSFSLNFTQSLMPTIKANLNILIKEWRSDQSFWESTTVMQSCVSPLWHFRRSVASHPLLTTACPAQQRLTKECCVPSSPLPPSHKYMLHYQEKVTYLLSFVNLKGCWECSVRKTTKQLKEPAKWEKLSALPHLCGHQLCPAESMNQAHKALLSSFSRENSLIQSLSLPGYVAHLHTFTSFPFMGRGGAEISFRTHSDPGNHQ